MDNNNKKRALGRGLESLFNVDNLNLEQMEEKIYTSITKEEIIELPLDELRPNPYQPRKIFKDEALEELAESIKEYGVFQPIIVKKSIKGYEIIAGERRYRASKIAGKTTIPAIIRTFTDDAMMEIALLENLQRENLSAIEEALAYKSLIEKLQITQENLSIKVGKSRSHITNILGLLRLPKEIQDLVVTEKISMGHARILSKIENTEKIFELSDKVINNKLSVRDLEEITSITKQDLNTEKKLPIKNNDNKKHKFLEEILKEKLKTRVKITDNKIIISYHGEENLKNLINLFNIEE